MSIVENLRAFNRKERFYLIGLALGRPDFALSDNFRDRLADTFDLDVPPDAFVAMDYHLDWLYAATLLPSVQDHKTTHPNSDGLITANQEDLDLLVAFEEGQATHLVLLECKGVTGWSNKQFCSKMARLKKIFGLDGRKYPAVQPHFGLISPRESKGLDKSCIPTWLLRKDQLPYIKMPIPSGLVSITRCGRDGTVSSRGDHWRLRPGFAYPRPSEI